jgi:hypothetical protein
MLPKGLLKRTALTTLIDGTSLNNPVCANEEPEHHCSAFFLASPSQVDLTKNVRKPLSSEQSLNSTRPDWR